MFEIKRMLVPINGMPFEDINSVMSENYIGVYTQHDGEEGYVIIPIDDLVFEIIFVPVPDNLEELDEKFYKAVGEHIEKVSDSRHLEIAICEL